MRVISEIYHSFLQGWRDANPYCLSRRLKNTKEQEMRESITEKQLDRMLKDTFPSSDPVAMY